LFVNNLYRFDGEIYPNQYNEDLPYDYLVWVNSEKF